ncbi:MAG TPA: glycosyltransferase [Kofleriaceae bacterium]|nr:glycosyltransferase [Kofleriaceae bacterium]
MTRYLLATWEGGGVIPPEMGLARRLIARGHEVRVLADPAVEAAARAAGCEFSPWVKAPHRHSLAPEDDLLRDWEFKNLFKLFRHVLDVFICGPADRFAADTLDVLAEHPADVVLADIMIFGAQIAAEASNLPLGVLVPNIYMRPCKGVPPVGPGFMPARGPLGWVRDAVVKSVGGRMWRKGLPAINRARTGLGLDPLDDIWTQQDRAGRVFVLTSESFDFVSPELPQNVRYLGPVLDDPSWAGSEWTPPWPEANRDPIVLVGLSSTYQEQQAALTRVVAALVELPVRALVTLGPALAPDAVTSPAPHVAIVQTAPHGLVLPHTSAVITHCGHGTTIRALAAGVPLVCMPMGRDQNDTAARVVARKAGLRLQPTAPSRTIRRALEAVLHQPHFGAGARTLRDAIQRDLLTDPAAQIEELGGAGPRVSSQRGADAMIG